MLWLFFIGFRLCSIWVFPKNSLFYRIEFEGFPQRNWRASNSKSFGYFGIRWTKYNANLWFQQFKYNEWLELWRSNFCKPLCPSCIAFVPSNPENLMKDLSISFSVSSCIIVWWRLIVFFSYGKFLHQYIRLQV